MSLKLGTTDINKAYIGSTEVSKAYLGSTIVYSSTPPNGLLNNLVSYYKMDTNGSFPDAHGSNPGTINGATFTTNGKINGAYDFDGNNDFINISDSPFDASGDFSVCGWVMFDDFSTTDNTRFFSKRDSGADGWMLLANTNGKLRVDFYGNNGNYFTNSIPTATLSTGIWYHLGFSYNNTSKLLQCYINGSPDGSVTTAGTPTRNNINFRLARNGTNYFDGKIDETAYYDGVLSPTDFVNLYNSGAGLSYDNFTT